MWTATLNNTSPFTAQRSQFRSVLCRGWPGMFTTKPRRKSSVSHPPNVNTNRVSFFVSNDANTVRNHARLRVKAMQRERPGKTASRSFSVCRRSQLSLVLFFVTKRFILLAFLPQFAVTTRSVRTRAFEKWISIPLFAFVVDYYRITRLGWVRAIAMKMTPIMMRTRVMLHGNRPSTAEYSPKSTRTSRNFPQNCAPLNTCE